MLNYWSSQCVIIGSNVFNRTSQYSRVDIARGLPYYPSAISVISNKKAETV